jgi:serine/threonine protein kinase/Tol biopolymer transport system component
LALNPGTRLGPYEIVAPLGAGGMGEVYRATDTNLKRQVAIKVLPASVAADPDRLARFQREAEILAALNHPNIAHIHGLEKSDGTVALVMELVEGPTLADRIARGSIPLDEALPIGKQIAEALEGAHEQGIIHRDLKPANIKIRQDGVVKVLDFGLAKAMDQAAGSTPNAAGDLTRSPTITSPAMMTGIGALLGTAAYMSPEQARGTPVDKRADLWAFGVVLFEMLTGKRLFEGATISDTLASVLKTDPDWTALPEQLPASIRRLLRRCLEKDRKRRIADAADARLEIDEALTAANTDAPAPSEDVSTAGSRGRTRVAWSVAAVFAAAALGLGALLSVQRAPPDPPVFRSTVLMDENLSASPPSHRFALSPDGRRLAYIASDANGRTSLWVRALDGVVGQSLAGTNGARAPFWSPDSRYIAFYADDKLKKVEATGGSPIAICATGDYAPNRPRSPGSWNRDDVIVFPAQDASSLSRVAAAGGTPTSVTTLDSSAGETQHLFPFFLPDGRHFLYVAFNDVVTLAVYVGSLDSPQRLRVMDAASNAQYAAGSLIFARGGTLMAQPFTLATSTLGGEPVPIGERVAMNISVVRAGAFSVSETGVLVYQDDSGARNSALMWSDRAGRRTPALDERASYRDVTLSPDDTQASVSIRDDRVQTGDIWIVNLTRRIKARFTFDPLDEFAGIWSSDGIDIVFNSRRKGHLDLYRKSVSGPGAEDVLLADQVDKTPTSWSPNRRFILYTISSQRSGYDIWVLPLTGDRKPFPFAATTYAEQWGQFSPDGNWVAYMSDESGHSEVYVTPFPGPGGKLPISESGGSYPRWRRNGKELFFQSLDNRLMAATLNVGTVRVDVEGVRPLFEAHAPEGAPRNFYDVSSDGERFLFTVPDAQTTATPLTLVTNWPALLKKGK